MNCPNGHGAMPLKEILQQLKFRDVNLTVTSQHHVCSQCKLEVGTVEQTAKLQKDIAEAYRKKAKLLPGEEIRELRRKLNLTQEGLAQKMGVGIASIKRWESSQIQTESMDRALREALEIKSPSVFTGNRELSIPRIRLVLNTFESCLNLRVVKKNDRFLFAAKYTWYADMVAYRDLGTSMTGATYAALPYGPQINNYKDLLELIINAEVEKAEPLSSDEKEIISKISKIFSTGQMVYDAAHREPIWKNASTGAIIPYSAATELIEI